MSSSSMLPQGLLDPVHVTSPLSHSLLSLLSQNMSIEIGSFYYLSLAFFKSCFNRCDDGDDMRLGGFTAIETYVNAETTFSVFSYILYLIS